MELKREIRAVARANDPERDKPVYEKCMKHLAQNAPDLRCESIECKSDLSEVARIGSRLCQLVEAKTHPAPGFGFRFHPISDVPLKEWLTRTMLDITTARTGFDRGVNIEIGPKPTAEELTNRELSGPDSQSYHDATANLVREQARGDKS